MGQEEIRRTLIDGTIHIIAREGLDKASTKLIGAATSINEAYIYRCFAHKEDMLVKTFDSLDQEFADKAMEHIEIMYSKEMDFEARSRTYFLLIWNFLMGNRDKCLAYVQYYYSPYFSKYSAPTHKKRFAPLVEKFSLAFRDEADVWMILNHILNVTLDFAVKTHNGHMSPEDDYVEHVFRVIYRSIEQYFTE